MPWSWLKPIGPGRIANRLEAPFVWKGELDRELTLFGGEGEIRQALLALLTNAGEAMPEGNNPRFLSGNRGWSVD